MQPISNVAQVLEYYEKVIIPVKDNIYKAFSFIKRNKLLNVFPETTLSFEYMKNLDGMYCPREKHITLNQLEIVDFFTTLVVLCHEFVHAEQHYTGRLVDYHSMLTVWTETGECYSRKFIHSLPPNYYNTLPWEKEAYERELPLALEINKLLKENNVVIPHNF